MICLRSTLPIDLINLFENPLLVFSTDTLSGINECWKLALFVEVQLLALEYAVLGCRHLLQLKYPPPSHQYSSALPAPTPSHEIGMKKLVEVDTGILTMESLVIQLLLERCVKMSEECLHLVCGYVQRRCHDDTRLVKLLHFQGYPPTLIPLFFRLVPIFSALVVDFLSELAAMLNVKQQLFSLHLFIHISTTSQASKHKSDANQLQLRDTLTNVTSTLVASPYKRTSPNTHDLIPLMDALFILFECDPSVASTVASWLVTVQDRVSEDRHPLVIQHAQAMATKILSSDLFSANNDATMANT